MTMAFTGQKFSTDVNVMRLHREEPTPDKMLMPPIILPEAKDTLRTSTSFISRACWVNSSSQGTDPYPPEYRPRRACLRGHRGH
jgi:hypothetical protein